MDSDRIIHIRCWHSDCCKIKAQCVPRDFLNYPHLLAEFKEQSSKLEKELPL